ncbi:hypothetical protein SMSP2_02904 [Limihaloglobus sulfuriphilus]|uniref:Ice-binding protein C-terminal domain-containing protein n=1 Tax=Limihaloglobus sulfuriphilus TaxID=1851148 RepID=A0A1Q2MIX8_9BACT|nr:PEP-CTERM sorting domain-containing protein [Limihaloglobus sulfuriphilus]AQQ72518.1 hypothetical protein SMSP2_02904 [Limihaloglobus sulfuriphilus]
MENLKFFTIAVCVFIAVTSASAAVLSFTFEPADGDPVANPGNEVSAVDYPYLYNYTLAWQNLESIDSPVNDFHLRWPTYYGGNLQIIPPENWTISEFTYNGPNCEANPSGEFTNVAGSLGGFKIYGKLPYLESGVAWLTKDGNQVGSETEVMLPALPEPATICLFALGAAAVIRRKNA